MKKHLIPLAILCLAFSFGCSHDQDSKKASPAPSVTATPFTKSGNTAAQLNNGSTLNFDLVAGTWGNAPAFGQIKLTAANNLYRINAVKDASFLDAGTTPPSEAAESGYSAQKVDIQVGHTYLVKIPGKPTRYSRVTITNAGPESGIDMIRFDFVTILDGKRAF